MVAKVKSDRRANARSKMSMTLLCGALLYVLPPLSHADNLTYTAQQSTEVQQIKIPAGKSAIIDVPVPIKRASLANPDIADAIVLSPKQIYVTGKAYGTTNLTLWGKDEHVYSIFDVEVGLDVTRLQARVHALLPDEDGIQISSTHDHVTLTGTVSSSGRLAQVQAVAEAYAPKKVLNFMKVHPEPREENPPSVVVELIKGTTVNHITPK